MPMKMWARALRDRHVSSREEKRLGYRVQGRAMEEKRDEWKREGRKTGRSTGEREKHTMS